MEFRQINFFPSKEEMLDSFTRSREKAENAISEMLLIPKEERNSENTLLAFENALSEFWDVVRPLYFLSQVSTSKETRDTARGIDQEASKWIIDLFTREDVYRAITSIKDADSLQGEDRKIFRRYVRGFKLSGLELPKEKMETLNKINKETTELGDEFLKNIAEHKDWLEITEEQLAGLNEDFIKGLERTSGGKYKITLDYPTYGGFMRNSPNESLRNLLEYKFTNVASDKNVKILQKLVKLRAERASILGYKSHGHLVMEDRMVKNPERVREFLTKIENKLKEKGREELNEILTFKKKDDPKSSKINSWDLAYYTNKLKKAKYSLDTDKIKEYFPLKKVIEGTFKIYEGLFGIRIEELKEKSWHPDAMPFLVYDSGTKALLGKFYLDLFPREGKYTHAAMFGITNCRLLKNGEYQKPISSVVANFTKPVGDKPSLITHGEVITFFHEFGHLMHDMLNKAKIGSISATEGVLRDFVEAPSQMLENWMWEKEALKLVSSHYKTGETIPDEVIEKLIEFKMFCGLSYLRQLHASNFDFIIHTEGGDPTEVWGRLAEKIALIPEQKGTHYCARFGHMAGGYDAQYYGYLWSEVFAQDMFSRFEEEGIFNQEVGKAYRKLILGEVIMYEEEKKVEEFLGRPSNEKAFMKSLGIRE